jgi:hypothetical protein
VATDLSEVVVWAAHVEGQEVARGRGEEQRDAPGDEAATGHAGVSGAALDTALDEEEWMITFGALTS